MREISITKLAYILKENKGNSLPAPIFFLGAGASVTGDIPTASGIVTKIIEKYSDNPFIKKISEDKRDYSNLMEALQPFQRNDLLNNIIKKAKLNVTHIYLAKLLKEGYADYVLTVNFDNLMLRALALYNIYPPTYDISILKELTTTQIRERSIVYLHGTHHGLWLLNTREEMRKTDNVVPRIIDSIKHNRPWIFIGYSGNDPVFDHIKNLGRFDNGIYWVGYKDDALNVKVENLLKKPNINSFLIKGYDSDSFMLKLNEELGINQPNILEKPFSQLKKTLDSINDIDDEIHFKGVKRRLHMSRKSVENAIQIFEKNKPSAIVEKDLNINRIGNEIIGLIISEKYEENVIREIINQIQKIDDNQLYELVAYYYFNWAYKFFEEAKSDNGNADLFHLGFEKIQKAVNINPIYTDAYKLWADNLVLFIETNRPSSFKELFEQVFSNYNQATAIKPEYYEAYFEWGNALSSYSDFIKGKSKQKAIRKSFDKYNKAIEIRPNLYQAYNGWGVSIAKLAQSFNEKDASILYKQAYDKFEKALEINPHLYQAYQNWGSTILIYASQSSVTEKDYWAKEALEKYHKAIKIKPKSPDMYRSMAHHFTDFANFNPNSARDYYFNLAFSYFKKAISFSSYSTSYKIYSDWGLSLSDYSNTKEGEESKEILLEALSIFEKASEINPDSYIVLNNWGLCLIQLSLLYKGEEKRDIQENSLRKFKEIIRINPDYLPAYKIIGTVLIDIAKEDGFKNNKELLEEAFYYLNNAVKIGGDYYNLALVLALQQQREEAFKHLDRALKRKEISVTDVVNDKIWEFFLEDKEFKKIINKYKK